ncbi:hypothetical protein EHRUM2_02060, partial [Ehrlichia ruminantium]
EVILYGVGNVSNVVIVKIFFLYYASLY